MESYWCIIWSNINKQTLEKAIVNVFLTLLGLHDQTDRPILIKFGTDTLITRRLFFIQKQYSARMSKELKC